MKKYFGALCIAAITFSCVNVQQIDLDGNATSGADSTKNKQFVSALANDNGNISMDWKSDDTKISITNDSEQVGLSFVDVKRTSFYHDFDGVDFRGGLAVRIEARVIEGEEVKLRLLMTDGEGLITNGKTIDNKVSNTEDFRPYFFRLKGAFIQTFPELANVNGADIHRLAFVVSPTGKAVTGKMEIKSVKIVSDGEVFGTKKLVGEGGKGAVVYNADSKFSAADWSMEAGYSLSQVGGDLVVNATGVGPRYESFSKSIPVTNAQMLKVVLKYEGDVQPFIRFDIEDVNGFVSNRKPAMVRALPGDYKEYVFDYSDRLRQAYPKQVDVDGSRIVKISGFIDPAYVPFTGTVYIKSIELF